MKAGAALGLLAGLGALNAIRGGREGTGKRFTGLMDMLDGGGAGASGDKFEGGGLLSILGNLFAKPLEAQDNVERIARETTERSVLRPKLRPTMTTGTPITEYSDSLLAPLVNQDVYGIGDSGEFSKVLPQPSVLSGGTTQPMPASSQTTDFDVNPAMLSEGSGRMYTEMADFKPSMPSPDSFSANPPSAAAMTPPVPAPEDRNSRLAAFNRRMESVPEFYRGTEIESMYRDHVLNGGLAYFDQFIRGTMAAQDQGLLRTAPTMTAPAAPTPPTIGFN